MENGRRAVRTAEGMAADFIVTVEINRTVLRVEERGSIVYLTDPLWRGLVAKTARACELSETAIYIYSVNSHASNVPVCPHSHHFCVPICPRLSPFS
jgi:hypothetical protein